MADTAWTPTDPELIDTWQAAAEALVVLGSGLDEEQWLLPTRCPGWTVADLVAHAIDIESIFGGLPRPEHEPDWDALRHVTSDFGRFTEPGVDARRGLPRTEVLDELTRTIAARRVALDALPPGAEVIGLAGTPVPLARFLRTRTFDLWAHEQDLRAAVGLAGGLDSDAAVIAYQQMTGALPYVWSRAVGAAPGDVLRVDITGPGLAGTLHVGVREDGKGAMVEPVEPTVTLTASWPDFTVLACGRPGADSLPVAVVGREDLAARLLPALAITP